MSSFVREAKGEWDQEAEGHKHHPRQWSFPKAHSVTTWRISFTFKRQRKKYKNRHFKTVGVLEEGALCGNDKDFVHNGSICQGHVAQVLLQKLETCLAGLEADSGVTVVPCLSLAL